MCIMLYTMNRTAKGRTQYTHADCMHNWTDVHAIHLNCLHELRSKYILNEMYIIIE